jgi:hypothetical protein
MVRAIRSDKYKYIRNYYPNQPYFLWIPYRDKHPIMEEIWRLHLEDKLSESQSLMFQCPRPREELYDIKKDPFEMNNLASEPEMVSVKNELSDALNQWMQKVGDYGETDEVQMVRSWYPDGVQPQTASPKFIPLSIDKAGTETSTGGVFSLPCKIHIYSSTQGASIVYRIKGDSENQQWFLYTNPFTLKKGKNMIEAKAIRIGYKESEITVASFDIV